uniref:Outer-membrane lipoprotein LolB n=1 Tax=Candidatus Kentrum eta TaxID=2126337 RepID=A0A450UVJ9_9GAMM|nr:MAG: outer membrane lipoprotein LolB [Candidatus Kentron sp. H]VFJ90142.1 MAG: outer membrane lipoprotein LolB [Candidatus Kentron sp. H]VFJ96500.1 MAG: outer membrane lipoprotein LolB [Candidatus Kentron sp. H]
MHEKRETHGPSKAYPRPLPRLILAVLPAVLLTACAMMPKLPWLTGADIDPAWRVQSDRLRNIRAWSVTGRIALHAEDEAWHARMHWRQQADDYRIRFNAPLAAGAAEITGGPDGVTLRTTDGRNLSAPDPESLLSHVMGWSIPVSGLRYWILGRPEADTPIARLKVDTEGRLIRLEQSGWAIRYLDYRGVEGFQLPAGLILENPHLTARIRIGGWTLTPDRSDEAADEGNAPDKGAGIRTGTMDTTLSVEPATRKGEPDPKEGSAPEEKPTDAKCKKTGPMRSVPLFGAVWDKFFCN